MGDLEGLPISGKPPKGGGLPDLDKSQKNKLYLNVLKHTKALEISKRGVPIFGTLQIGCKICQHNTEIIQPPFPDKDF